MNTAGSLDLMIARIVASTVVGKLLAVTRKLPRLFST
jgi:hypothetical protein